MLRVADALRVDRGLSLPQHICFHIVASHAFFVFLSFSKAHINKTIHFCDFISTLNKTLQTCSCSEQINSDWQRDNQKAGQNSRWGTLTCFCKTVRSWGLCTFWVSSQQRLKRPENGAIYIHCARLLCSTAKCLTAFSQQPPVPLAIARMGKRRLRFVLAEYVTDVGMPRVDGVLMDTVSYTCATRAFERTFQSNDLRNFKCSLNWKSSAGLHDNSRRKFKISAFACQVLVPPLLPCFVVDENLILALK